MSEQGLSELAMSTGEPGLGIQLTQMRQLAEAVEREDDWTGLTDAAARRKRQNRLNVRAYRRRKAQESKALISSASTPAADTPEGKTQQAFWIEAHQVVVTVPASPAESFASPRNPLIPRGSAAPSGIIFPLSSDHLITLIQYNVLRAFLLNRSLLPPTTAPPHQECASAALHVLPAPADPSMTSAQQRQPVPPCLRPTLLQCTVPHEAWIDIVPHPVWRDNAIRAAGTYDEDELWADTIGGLFDGFSDSEYARRGGTGVVAWSPPWDISGWEVSEGFWRKWGWLLRGCGDALEATNRWRALRGEEPLVVEI